MTERILQVKTEMESVAPQAEEFIKVEHMDYILGISTSEEGPDIAEESSSSEHVSVKVEPEDSTCADISDMNICVNSNIGAHLQPVVVLKSQEFLKTSWEDFKAFLKKEQSKLKNQSFPSVANSDCIFIEDGFSINDHDIIHYLEVCSRETLGCQWRSKKFEDLKSTLSEAYALYHGRYFATDFSQAWKHLPVQKQSVMSFQKNQEKEFGKKFRERMWMRLCEMTKKEGDFTDSDMTSFFKLEAKRWKPITFKNNQFVIRRCYRDKNGRNFNEDFPEADHFITEYLNKSRSKILNSKGGGNKSSSGRVTKKWTSNRKQKQKQQHYERLWKKLCEMSHKQVGFSDSEMSSFFKSESENNNWKPRKLRELKYAFTKLYKEKHGKDFKDDFPETCLFIRKSRKRIEYDIGGKEDQTTDNLSQISDCINDTCNGTNSATSSENENSDRINLRHREPSSRRIVPKNQEGAKKSIDLKKYQESFWMRFCQMTQKESDFTDSEIISFFKFELKTKKWKHTTLNQHLTIFRRLYREKHAKEFDEDFPEACQFVKDYVKKPRYNVVSSKGTVTTKVARRKDRFMYFERIWKRLCEMTKKDVGFTDSEMTSFLKFEAQTRNWQPKTLCSIQSAFRTLYQEKHERNFEEDFPKACSFIAEKMKTNFDDKENEDTNNVPQNDDSMNKTPESFSLRDNEEDLRRLEVWQEFCNFTKKSEDFDEKHIIDFMQSETTKSQRMTNWLYPLAEAYTLKFDKDFWFEYPNVFKYLLKKEQ